MLSNISLYLILLLCLANLTVIGQPSITSVTPAKAAVNSTVVISGNHFDVQADSNIVYFGASRARVVTASATSLSVIVPSGQTCENLTVTVNGLTAYSNHPFNVAFTGADETFSQYSFEPEVFTTVAGEPYRPVITDLDMDGKPDAVVFSNWAGIGYLFNNSRYVEPVLDRWTGYSNEQSINEVVSADLDGDGRHDLILSKTNPNTITIIRNLSDSGSFKLDQRINITPGNIPEHLAIADIDFDGRPDIIARDGTSQFVIYPNQSTPGNIIFGSPVKRASHSDTRALSVADMDNDGKPDLVVVAGVNLCLIKNNSSPGNFSFTYPQATQIPANAKKIVLSDLDGDGFKDAAIEFADLPEFFTICRNTTNPDAFFANPQQIPMPLWPTSFLATDLDGDAKPEIISGSQNAKQLNVLKNTSIAGNITFKPVYQVPLSHYPYFVTTGDMDMDGKQDVVIGNLLDKILIARNKVNEPSVTSFAPVIAGEGDTVIVNGRKFSNAFRVLFGETSAKSFRVLNDSTIEAIVGNGTTGEVSVQTDPGKGSLPGFTYVSKAPVINAIFPVAEFIGNSVSIKGRYFSDFPANNIVYFGDVEAEVLAASDTLLTVRVPRGANFDRVSVTTNRLTGLSSQFFSVKFTAGAAAFSSISFETHTILNSGMLIKHLEANDLNDDSLPDVAVASGTALHVFRNETVGHNVRLKNVGQNDAINKTVKKIALADLNGDGKPELLWTNSETGLVSFFANQSSGKDFIFVFRKDLIMNGDPITLKVEDLNLDGRPDIVSSRPDKDFVNIFQNITPSSVSLTAINFEQRIPRGGSGYPVNICIADLDKDGKAEIICTSDSSNVRVLHNHSVSGDFNLNTYSSIATKASSGKIACGDLNGDGWNDLAVLHTNTNEVGVLINNKDTLFHTFKSEILLNTGDHPEGIAIGDLDGDGVPEIVTANSLSNNVSLFKNKSAGELISFASKFDIPVGKKPAEIILTDLDVDGKIDMLIANTGDSTLGFLRNRNGEPGVMASGNNPVSGNINAEVKIDSVNITNDGILFVQRHYVIEPENNADKATATITLYFTQQEFDSYNSTPGHGADLPKHPDDAAGKAALRIYQFHGFSATGQPGDYPGDAIEINPEDSKIIWNQTTEMWEVTFDVTGFSGFYLAGKALQPFPGDDENNLFRLYPNPAKGSFRINVPALENLTLNVFDINGRKIITKRFPSSPAAVKIELPVLSPGVYLVVLNSSRMKWTGKLIVDR